MRTGLAGTEMTGGACLLAWQLEAVPLTLTRRTIHRAPAFEVLQSIAPRLA